MALIVAIGGATNPKGSTERALGVVCATAAAQGAEIALFNGAYLANLPFYRGPGWTSDHGKEMLDAIRLARGFIICTPGYHGTISGMVKNGLDYVEELASDERVYLDNRPVGLLVTAFGHQAAGSALQTLRTITHALRGWPTPYGAAIKVSPTTFTPEGDCLDPTIKAQLELVGSQVSRGVRLRQILHEMGEV